MVIWGIWGWTVMRREGWQFEQSRWMVEGEKEGREGAGKKA